ncbi:MAG: hypothetical protein K0R57_5267 [Paenibacillaceae bacterium]|jgi:AraC-like DNA-binding protein|nr:hypothetical protein [Paenibacillaceae bacterium]
MNKPEPLQLATVPFDVKVEAVNGQRLNGYSHYHQGIEFLFIHEGKGTVFVHDRRYEIASGQLYFFQPFQYHQVLLNNRMPYRRTVIKFDPVALLPYLQPFSALTQFFNHIWKGNPAEQCAVAPSLSFASLACLQQRLHALSEQEAMESFAAHMASVLETLRSSSSLAPAGPQPLDQPTRYYSEAVMQWLEGHLHEPFRLECLAEALHLSKNHLSRRFKSETGSSIQECLAAKRIRKACHLLCATSLTVDQIALQIGLESPSYFCKLFKDYVGQSPLQYRRSIRP